MRKPQKRYVSPYPTAYTLNPKNLTRELSTTNQKNWLEDTILYGEDDCLPLRIAQAVEESPATSACIATVSQFIKGSRFSDQNLMSLKVDQHGTTLWDFHTQLSDYLSLFEGFAVNFKYDFEGRITNAYILPFESVRFVKSSSRDIKLLKYNPYFGTVEYKKDYTITYNAFNPKTILNEIQAQGIAYQGQVYYYGSTRPLYKFYPVPKYWSGKHWIYVDGKIQEFHKENLDNGFFQSVLMNVIGDPNQPSKNPKYQEIYTDEGGIKRTRSSKTVGEEFNEQMGEAFSGSKKAGTALVQWSLNADTSTKIQAFPTNSNFDVLAGTLSDAIRGITMATEVPAVLANLPQQQSSLGSDGNSIQKAVELMQSRVASKQRKLELFYNEILLPMMGISAEVKIVNFVPVAQEVRIEDKFWAELSKKEKLSYIETNVPGVSLEPTSEQQVTNERTLVEVIGVGGTQALLNVIQLYGEGTLSQSQASNTLQLLFGISAQEALSMLMKEQLIDGVEPTQEIKTNDNLKNLTGRQLQGIQRIVRKYNKEELTFEQAAQLLKNGFGFTDEDVNAWIVTPEEI